MRRFAAKDLPEINGWREARKAGLLPFTPRTAFFVPGVAFGALLVTDCGVAFIDGYTSNPDARSEDRASAFEDITIELLGEAMRQHVKTLYVVTSDVSIAKRALDGGGRFLGQCAVFGMTL
jgi:hypothetical protein